MALPSSAMRVTSSSSETTSSPRSGSASNGGGTRRGGAAPGIGGTPAAARPLPRVGGRGQRGGVGRIELGGEGGQQVGVVGQQGGGAGQERSHVTAGHVVQQRQHP